MNKFLYLFSCCFFSALITFYLAIGTSRLIRPPIFDTSGEKNIAIDKEIGLPVLVIDREYYGKNGWHYTVVVPWEINKYGDGSGINWRTDKQLVIPKDWKQSRLLLQKNLPDCILHMNKSTTDLNLHQIYDIHVANEGYWSVPIKDGKVDIQVTPVDNN